MVASSKPIHPPNHPLTFLPTYLRAARRDHPVLTTYYLLLTTHYLLLQRGVVIQSFYTDGAPAAQQWPHGMAEMNVLGERGGAAHIRVLEVSK